MTSNPALTYLRTAQRFERAARLARRASKTATGLRHTELLDHATQAERAAERFRTYYRQAREKPS